MPIRLCLKNLSHMISLYLPRGLGLHTIYVPHSLRSYLDELTTKAFFSPAHPSSTPFLLFWTKTVGEAHDVSLQKDTGTQIFLALSCSPRSLYRKISTTTTHISSFGRSSKPSVSLLPRQLARCFG